MVFRGRFRVMIHDDGSLLLKGGKASPTGNTSTVRSSWRERPLLRENAVSEGLSLPAMMHTASNRLDWLAFNWTRRWLPVSRTISNVFLTVHGVEGE